MRNTNLLDKLSGDLTRLARFGANIADAHSCFVLLPAGQIESGSAKRTAAPLDLIAYHSLSPTQVQSSPISVNSGLIGWVARHRRPIHVSPFEHDSRTIGVYAADVQLKSFIGIPVNLPKSLNGRTTWASGTLNTGENVATAADYYTGVLACDSKKSFAFSKLQGKLLEDLALEISNTISLNLEPRMSASADAGWSEFAQRAEDLVGTLGPASIEVIRLRPTNFDKLERSIGLGRTCALLDQVKRLIQQALPPHYPCICLPDGDIVLVVDNMMSGFYESKISALCNHVQVSSQRLLFEGSRISFNERRQKKLTIEQLISEAVEKFTRSSAPGNIPSRNIIEDIDDFSTPSSAKQFLKVAAYGNR